MENCLVVVVVLSTAVYKIFTTKTDQLDFAGHLWLSQIYRFFYYYYLFTHTLIDHLFLELLKKWKSLPQKITPSALGMVCPVAQIYDRGWQIINLIFICRSYICYILYLFISPLLWLADLVPSQLCSTTLSSLIVHMRASGCITNPPPCGAELKVIPTNLLFQQTHLLRLCLTRCSRALRCTQEHVNIFTRTRSCPPGL